MTLRHAIIEATVPSVTGTVDYTASGISSWSSVGLALAFVSGDTAELTLGAFLSIGAVNQAGVQFCTGYHSADGLTSTPFNKEVHGDDCVVFLPTRSGTVLDAIARAKFSAALSNGVRLNWDVINGIGSRIVKIVVVLIEGLSNATVNASSSTSVGFQADAMMLFPSGNSVYSGTGTGVGVGGVTVCCTGLGGVLRDGSLTQRSAFCMSDDAVDPLVSRGDRRTADWSCASAGTTEDVSAITSIGATSWTDSGTSRGFWLATKSAVADFGVAKESLDGTTGAKSFTNLGGRFGLIIGFICAATTDDTFAADNATFARFTYFITDGNTTISVGIGQRHTGTTISAANPTDTYSQYDNGSIRCIDHLNATDFQATVTGITATGIDLNVTDGMSGAMILFGFNTALAPLVTTDTEQISDGIFLNLISRLVVNETEQLSDAGPQLTVETFKRYVPEGTVLE